MISICVMIYVGIFAQEKPEFRIRTITAGINLKSVDDLVTIKSAITFLQSAKSIYESNGYEVQTLRIATQNFQQYKGKQNWIETIESLRKIDHILDEAGVIIALGQVIESDQEISEVPEWAATLIRKTNHINFSMQIATPQTGIHLSTIRTAAKTMIALSTAAPRGEGNFRFTATANLPATTPFYPAAWHKGKHSFAIGLESPKLLMKAFRNADLNQAKDRLTKLMNRQLKPVEKIARSIASEDWQYDGI
ncbi:MAG: DUF711 family protein, partial [Calditrichaeota bacterium]|nr:DUF711 family protein [Calditrichota bacterium]